MAKMEEEVNTDGVGPLGFLEHLLQEERESNELLGDTRFWQYYEHITSTQIYDRKSIEYRTLKLMFWEAVFYMMHILAATAFIVNMQSGALYDCRVQQLDYWGGCYKGQAPCRIDSIYSAESLMAWMHDELVPKAFTQRDEYPNITNYTSIFELTQDSMRWHPRYVGDTETSILLGSFRIRTNRVQVNRSCEVLPAFAELGDPCIPSAAQGRESKRTYNQKWMPDHLLEPFIFRYQNYTTQMETEGKEATYPGSGYFFDLPLIKENATLLMAELAEWTWLDEMTRSVILEFNVFFPNVNVIVHNRMLFEFLSTGGVSVRHDVTAFRVFQLSISLMITDAETIFIYQIITLATHILLLLFVLFSFVKTGPRHYFTYIWNLVDVAMLAIFGVLLINHFFLWSEVEVEPNLDPQVVADPALFMPFANFLERLRVEQILFAGLGVLTWVKVFKYFTFITMFQVPVRVIEKSIAKLFTFLLMLCLIVFGFAIAFYLGFGGQAEDVSTLRASFFAMFYTIAGSMDFEPMFKNSDLLAPLLFFLYIALIFFFFIGYFMAMVIEVYVLYKYEHAQIITRFGAYQNPMSTFLWTYWNACKGIKLVGHEVPEVIGEPDEQFILLSCLPQELADKYRAHKASMREMLEESEKSLSKKGKKRFKRALTDSQSPKSDLLAIQDQANPASGKRPDEYVNRVQIQRVINDDPKLKAVLGTSRAIDIIRRFQVVKTDTSYEAASRLQAEIAQKLHELAEVNLKGSGAKFAADEVQHLKTVSMELHAQLTEVQRQWRTELTSVLQMSSVLSRSLSKLADRIAQVQSNHNQITSEATGG